MTAADIEALRPRIAEVVAQAVNTALAGVSAPGRVDSGGDGALYYADRILSLLKREGSADVG